MVSAKLSAWCRCSLPLSSSLLEKAMAWTRKSSLPHSFSSLAKTASMLAASVTSHWVDDLGADRLGQRPHALLDRLALEGEGQLGALGVAGLGRCPRRSSVRWRRPSRGRACRPSVVQLRSCCGSSWGWQLGQDAGGGTLRTPSYCGHDQGNHRSAGAFRRLVRRSRHFRAQRSLRHGPGHGRSGRHPGRAHGSAEGL
jgi:hypothetical protein